ncbi:MAG: uracil-DNA glycosylase [Bacteroidia bacterium]|nr:uracil-DNA glycosylase [Bacteroidia bacterium]
MLTELPGNDWDLILGNEFNKPYFKHLIDFLEEEKQYQMVYPKSSEIFNAFKFTPFSQVKVIILGQDPYHGSNQAHGLSFSVNHGIKPPPSLNNIFKELQSDVGFKIPKHGNLTHWSTQGVLLLNATLTVRAGQAGSHQNKGWENFTDGVIKTLSEEKSNCVFLLWGNFAQSKQSLINANKHCILTAAHPSPLARGAFFGCKHFSKTNDYLQQHHLKPIDWQIPILELF